MSRPTLHQIAQTAAADGDIPTWDDSAGLWVPTAPPAAVIDPTTTKGDLIVRGAAALGRLPVGATTGHVLTVDPAEALGMKWAPPASGGSSPWTKNLDNPLTAATGFTSLSGTWGAGSGQIAQTGTAAQYNRLYYATRIVRALGAIQLEVRYDSGGSGATRALGALLNFDPAASGGNSGGLAFYLITTNTGTTWSVRAEGDGWTPLLNIGVTYVAGNYATLAAVYTTQGIEFYFNGTYLGLSHNTDTTHRSVEASYVGLMSYAATATYRNLKVWGLTPPF